MLNQETLQDISLFTSKELFSTAKNIMSLYVEYGAELDEVFGSENIEYKAVQDALDNFWKVGKELIEDGFSSSSNLLIEDIHIQAAKEVLSELNKVVVSQKLKDTITGVQLHLDSMKGKKLKSALKDFDQQEIQF